MNHPEHWLEQHIRDVHPELSQEQISILFRHLHLLGDWNTRLNLTAHREPGDLARRMTLESLRLVRPILEELGDVPRPRVLDLGTGGGIPGLVLAIACPQVHFVLLDATGKKIAAVQAMADDLGLQNVETLHARAEDAARDDTWRGSFQVVTARAVSSIATLVELGLPFLRMHGSLVMPKGMQIADELAQGKRAAVLIGGAYEYDRILEPNGSELDTRLVVFRKTKKTSVAYPRRSGLPARQPLG